MKSPWTLRHRVSKPAWAFNSLPRPTWYLLIVTPVTGNPVNRAMFLRTNRDKCARPVISKFPFLLSNNLTRSLCPLYLHLSSCSGLRPLSPGSIFLPHRAADPAPTVQEPGACAQVVKPRGQVVLVATDALSEILVSKLIGEMKGLAPAPLVEKRS